MAEDGAGETGFFDHFRENPEQLAKLEAAASRIGKLLSEQAARITRGDLDIAGAMAEYTAAAMAILGEEGVSEEAVLKLNDDHPLKGYFFGCLDQEIFEDLQQQFVQAHQETEKQAGKEAWDAEPAVGEADGEDHTLE